MRKMNNPFKDKSLYSFTVLTSILAADILSVIALHWRCYGYLPYLLGILAVIILVWIIRWIAFGGNPFWVRSKILTRLMANAITPTWIGAFYLLFFIIHLGWITDGSFNLFLPSNNNKTEVISSLIIAVGGITALIEFFPEAKTEKGKIRNKIFVSGISALFNVPQDLDSDKFNVRPLVRILQETERNEEDCTLLILLSDYYTTAKEKDKDKEEMEMQRRSNVIKDTIKMVCPYASMLDFDNMNIEEKLRILIKQIAIREFPDSENWITGKLNIQFTKSVNYDDYPTCFELLSNSIKKYDSKHAELCFNLTPGTAPISSIVTLLSIDSKRKLYYYSQDSRFKDNPIIEVDKTKVPLENLLSQSLDTLRENS